MDSDFIDEYFYMIMVYIGFCWGVGIKFVVNFVVVGDEDDFGVWIFSDGIKEVLLFLWL